MARTSATQFELLVAFMEEHGDLNRSTGTVKGSEHYRQWEELVKLLNSEGEPKPLVKWKKVWSDLKNNTKRKAARIERASSQGILSSLIITELEQRVLNLGGIETTTKFVKVMEPRSLGQASTVSSSPQTISPEPAEHKPTVLETSPPAESSYTFTFLEPNTPGECGETEQPRPSSANLVTHPSKLRHMSPQRRIRRNKRLRDTLNADVQSYLNSESQWRKFKMEQHKAQIELEREKNRIRELEIQTQRGWIGLGHRFIDVLGQFLNKFQQ